MSAPPRVYVDSQILIYSGELDPRYWHLLRDLWADAGAGRLSVMTSELSVLECLVHPLRHKDTILINGFNAMFARTDIQMLPINRVALRTASQLRADIQPLRTPDAIHAATALTSGATAFLTNDRGFRRVPGLDVRLLDDGQPQFS